MILHRNLRILAVDDNPAIHDDFHKILTVPASESETMAAAEAVLFGSRPEVTAHLPFEITSAYQGEEALAMVKAAVEKGKPYAMAFVDVRMPPGWDGVETIHHLWEVDPHLQVVICTAYSDYFWEEIAKRLGRSDSLLILKKPFDNVEVLQVAHALTRKWQLREQAQMRMEELDRLVAERTEALRASEERLRQAQKMEAIGQLAAGVAHDFNNILTVIQGHAGLQLARGNLAPEALESFQQVSAAAERAASLTRQLLAFSRKQVMQRGPVDLNQVIGRLTKMLRRLIGEHIELSIATAKDLPVVRGDATNLEQIILNLVVNARDAMPKGGTITVETAFEDMTRAMTTRHPDAAVGPHVRLSVRDTGTGIDPANLERIFEPFFTTKDPGLGTGMGLATVHGIVKQHGGWIEVASGVGAGSTFSVFLPASSEKEILTEEQSAAILPPGEGRTILIVEDEDHVRALVREVLERAGYRVLEAADAQKAMDLWRAHAPQVRLLFTDMVLPGGMSGSDLARLMRTGRPDLPVIFTSGYASPHTAADTVLEEGVNYLAKPYQTRAIAALLRRHFGEGVVPVGG